MLLRFNRDRRDVEIEVACNQIKSIIDQINIARNKNELLGMEGIATRYYFKVFARLIKETKIIFNFEKRTKRPPLDPVNALLSFGYSLLVSNMVSSLSTVGLDPYIGFFTQQNMDVRSCLRHDGRVSTYYRRLTCGFND
jgi:CRISPR-associated protein Cas1